MSFSVLSYKYSVDKAQDFVNQIDSNANNIFYLFLAKHMPFANGDSNIPTPLDDTHDTYEDIWKNMIFGKHISANDVQIMIPRYDWAANTVFAIYNDQDPNLISEKFYTVVTGNAQYDVFKCLYNAGGANSTVAPSLAQTSPADIFYETADGYQWKYMYSIDSAIYNSFTTSNFIPVLNNANVQGNAVPGSIDVILVTSPGAGYNNYTNGQFALSDITVAGNTLVYNINSSASIVNGFYTTCYLYLTGGTGVGQYQPITNYFIAGLYKQVVLAAPFTTTPDATTTYEILPRVQVTGDGNQTINCSAMALINTVGNTINQIQILNRGKNYMVATANVLFSPVLSITNPANLQVIIPPAGGHGANSIEELGGIYTGISVTFSNTESNTIPATNTFRCYGIIKQPLFANVTLSIENSAGSPGSNGVFTVGQTVTQANSGAYGIITAVTANTIVLTNVSGIFVTGNNSFAVISSATANAQVHTITNNDQIKNFETFNQMTRLTGNLISGSFQQDEIVWEGNIASVNAALHSISTVNSISTLYVSNTYGNFFTGNVATGNTSLALLEINSMFPGDLVIGSGDIYYVENFSPITRSANTSESIILVLGY